MEVVANDVYIVNKSSDMPCGISSRSGGGGQETISLNNSPNQGREEVNTAHPQTLWRVVDGLRVCRDT